MTTLDPAGMTAPLLPVTVSVIAYREFYISGEVRKPGGYPYQPGLTLNRAIALASSPAEAAHIRLHLDRLGTLPALPPATMAK